MNKLDSFDENKKKCCSCKEYFEALITADIDICESCLKESLPPSFGGIGIRQFINKKFNHENNCPCQSYRVLNPKRSHVRYLMARYSQIRSLQRKLMDDHHKVPLTYDDFKNEQT